jgi:protein AroM
MKLTVKAGFVTIGQSPREDVVPEIVSIVGPRVRIQEKGALDGLSGEEIGNLRPGKGDFRLITRLRDGSTVVLGKKRVLPLLNKKINELVEQDVRLIALLCTDEFPSIARQYRGGSIVLQPAQLLRDEAVGRLKEGKLGIFVPLEEQKEAIKRKWKKAGLRVAVEALNPYGEAAGDNEAIERMRRERVDVMALDCIGYSRETQDRLERIFDRPALLPRAVLASAIKKWLRGQDEKTG